MTYQNLEYNERNKKFKTLESLPDNFEEEEDERNDGVDSIN